ncbi:MAG: lipoyl synthase [Planctomycetota bacterium]
MRNAKDVGGRPSWLRVSIPGGESLSRVDRLMARRGLHTVCQEAHCPNIYECYAAGTATFLILGEVCSRRCGFCAVSKGTPAPVDSEEPAEIARAAAAMELRHVVVTSVNRDDLRDEGAGQFALTLEALARELPAATTEVLTPDFRREPEHGLETVLAARPTIFSHNLETVRRLYPGVRPGSNYDASLALLAAACARQGGSWVKSSLILGLGEREEEIRSAIGDLHDAGVRRLSLGQYLSPSHRHIPVKRYYTPGEFRELGDLARELGFEKVESAPLVRSSYHAEA